MDKIIKERTSRKRYLLLGLCLLGGAAALLAYGLKRQIGFTLERERVRLASVTEAPFYEYINLDGTVEPVETYVIDSKIAGNVDRIYVSSGQQIRRKDTLLRISNADLELEVMRQESQLIEQLNNQRQTKILLDQNDFTRKEQMVEVDYQLALQKKEMARATDLMAGGVIAQREYDAAENRFAFLRSRRMLLGSSFRADSAARASQLAQINAFELRILSNLDQVRSIINRLYVLAEKDGRLSDFDLQPGESIASGQRLGEIYDLVSPNIVAEVDEFYLGKVLVGQKGVLLREGDSIGLTVQKIYPTVSAGRFRIEVGIEGGGAAPPVFVKGQSVRFRLFFGEEQTTPLLPNDGFYASTGGHWIYRLGPSGAERVDIRLGRSNPNYFEVLEGLSPGDSVIVSGYEGFSQYQSITLQ